MRICCQHYSSCMGTMRYIRHAFCLLFLPLKSGARMVPLRSFSVVRNAAPNSTLLLTNEQVQQLLNTVQTQITKTSTSLAKLEELTDATKREKHILSLCERRTKLSTLQQHLSDHTYVATTAAEDIIGEAKACGIQLPVQKSLQCKGPRLPYHVFHSCDGVKILVGRSAADNDELSLNREHRDDNFWWMHVADSPGSHVVIASSASDIRRTYPETILDAAALSAKYSKCTSPRAEVHMTQCKNIRKPFGAKPGLVQLTGKVERIRVDMKYQKSRMERLESSKSNNS